MAAGRKKGRGIAVAMAGTVACCIAAAAALAGPGGLRPVGCIDAPPALGSDDCSDSTSGLDSAGAIALSPDGKSLYATGFESDAIVSFRRDRGSGDLSARGCIEDVDTVATGCAALNGGLDGPIDLAVSPDGRSVYVLALNDDSISIFTRNRRNGRLTSAGCIADDDIAPSDDDCGVVPAVTLEFPASLAISPDGRSVYATSVFDAGVQELRRNRQTGALSVRGCVDDDTGPETCGAVADALDGPNGVAISPNGKSVYVAAADDQAVAHLRRDRDSGALNPRGCVDDEDTGPEDCGRESPGLNGAQDVVAGPEGRSLYAISQEDSALVRFRVRASSGVLRPAGCIDDWASSEACSTIALIGNPIEAAISPDGRSLYLAAFNDDSVAAFSRNRRSGAVASLGCTADEDGNGGGAFEQCTHEAPGMNGVSGLAMSPDGDFLYTSSQFDDAVTVFGRR